MIMITSSNKKMVLSRSVMSGWIEGALEGLF